jgi:ribosomal protein S18 acetylase RimI-like enzyme
MAAPAASVTIRRLRTVDAPAYRALRLAGLREAPSAFGSSFEEERDLPLSVFEARLADAADAGFFGAFDRGELVGIVGLGRESRAKLLHRGNLFSVMVAPQARRRGVARALVLEALALARSAPGMRQLTLCVNAGNAGAIALYGSLGFEAFGREPDALLVDGVLHDEIHMMLRLPPG